MTKTPAIKKQRVIGRAEKRRYDLPLNHGAGSKFLTTLIGLMTVLAMLALFASFGLAAMVDRWSSGLENRLTIEIPAQTKEKNLLPRAEIQRLANEIGAALQGTNGVRSVHVLTENEIGDLVEPWLGDDVLNGDFPVPGVIAIETTDNSTGILQTIYSTASRIAPHARMDTHEEWLNDLLRFTRALQLGAAIVVLVIGATTITAIAGGVRSRLALYHADVELLHIMGASDRYITKQFQRHAMLLALRGAVIGAVAAILVLALGALIAGEMNVGLLPEFKISIAQVIGLAALPAVVTAIATMTARTTVLKALAEFP